MPKIRSSRIEINPEVWPALQVEAIIRKMSPKDLVNQLIVNCLSQKAREFLRAETTYPIILGPPAKPTRIVILHVILKGDGIWIF